ncbi:MAG: tRNA (adenosine(37)-N6)-threonylcarbamoyltransferase complex dimerization subunit type 1 TsaB [Tsuneonella sp.]
MRTLAIECATEACSIALYDGANLLAADHRVLGRGHAEHLVPMIAALPQNGRADRILVSLGPGSFTGVRIGISVAGAMAIAWRAEVLGYPTLELVAAMGLAQYPSSSLTVCMTGGHGEWFVQDFGTDGLPEAEVKSLSPDAARTHGAKQLITGSRATDFAALLGGGHTAHAVLPDAAHTDLLSPGSLTRAIAPVYGRGPDAKLPA